MSQQARDDSGFERFERLLEEWSRRDFLKRAGGTAALAAFLAGGGELLAACSGGSRPTSSPSPRKGGHLIEGSISDIKTTNPVLASDTPSQEIWSAIYEGLLNQKANGELVPALAKELPKVSSDSLTYTFTLRDDLKFSDGSRLTAEDVKFTYDLMFDPAYRAVNSPRRGDLEHYIESISVPDPKTVVFKTKTVFAPFLSQHGQYGILPKAVWGGLSAAQVNTTDLNSKPTVTSGMFKLDRWDKGQQVVLSANESYYLGRPNLDTYVYKVVKDATAVADQLKNGEIDYGALDPSVVAGVQGLPDVDVITFAVAIFTFYGYQLDPAKPASKLFGDRSVRQALLYALNREQMADAVYFKQAVVANTTIPPISWAYDPNAKPQYPHDRARAERMLDDAGWKKGPDGVRANASGTKLAFEMITNQGNKARESLLQVMQQQWKEIGVEATPKLVSFPDLVTQITNQRSFDMFLVGFSWDADPNQAQFWHSRNTAPGGFNGVDYRNPKLDQILDDAVATLDRKKRKELYFQMQDILNEDVPAPVLLFNKGIWGVRKRVQGITGGDLGLGAFTQFQPRPWLHRAFVTDGK